MSKTMLRKSFLDKRKLYASSNASLEICKKAINHPSYLKAKTVMVYLTSNHEVDTAFIIADALKKGKKVCAPRVISESEMECASFSSSLFKKGAFHIWEPRGEVVSNPDIVFVPGVAFDKKHNRLGYGRGYYDRFLSDKNCVTIGLCYSCQIADDIPAEPHDRRLDLIITENEVF